MMIKCKCIYHNEISNDNLFFELGEKFNLFGMEEVLNVMADSEVSSFNFTINDTSFSFKKFYNILIMDINEKIKEDIFLRYINTYFLEKIEN